MSRRFSLRFVAVGLLTTVLVTFVPPVRVAGYGARAGHDQITRTSFRLLEQKNLLYTDSRASLSNQEILESLVSGNADEDIREFASIPSHFYEWDSERGFYGLLISAPGSLQRAREVWWPRAVDAFRRAVATHNRQDYLDAYYFLGHVMHLLQDASVPAHTRNDCHAGHALGILCDLDLHVAGSDFFELFVDGQLDVLPTPVDIGVLEARRVTGLDQLWGRRGSGSGMAQETGRHFFSNDTLFRREFGGGCYTSPSPPSSLDWSRFSSVTEAGSIVYYLRGTAFGTEVKLARLTLLGRAWLQSGRQPSSCDEWSRVVSLRRANGSLNDYWRIIGPRVVAASAGLVLLLYAQVEGKIYVADTDNHRIVRVDNMQGDGWISFGSRGNGVGQFLEPAGIAVDSRGRIYVADTGNHRIVRIDDITTGAGWKTFGSLGTGVGQFRAPLDVHVDGSDRIYVADNANFRVVILRDLSVSGWSEIPAGLNTNVSGVWADSPSRIYAVLVLDHKIVRLPGGGSFGSRGTGAGQFTYPWGVAVDSANRIYVTEWIGSRIARFNSMLGTGWVTFNGSGGNRIWGPRGIFIDGNGRIYVAEWNTHRISRLDDMTGAGWMTFGTAGSGAKQFLYPSDVFVR